MRKRAWNSHFSGGLGKSSTDCWINWIWILKTIFGWAFKLMGLTRSTLKEIRSQLTVNCLKIPLFILKVCWQESLGKRSWNSNFHGGLGKRRWNSNFSGGLGKRAWNSNFSGGLGKRAWNKNFSGIAFPFNLTFSYSCLLGTGGYGKRAWNSNFSGGLGKRAWNSGFSGNKTLIHLWPIKDP